MLTQSTGEMQMGKAGITTDEAAMYQIKLDYMRMSGIDKPEKYLIDPESPEAQQAAQQSQIMQQQEMQKQEQKQDMLTMMQMDLQTRQVDNQQAEVMRNYEADKEELAQKYDSDMKEYSFKFEELYKDLQFKYDELMAKSEIDEAKIIGDATTKIELEGMKGIESQAGRDSDDMAKTNNDDVDTKIADAIRSIPKQENIAPVINVTTPDVNVNIDANGDKKVDIQYDEQGNIIGGISSSVGE